MSSPSPSWASPTQVKLLVKTSKPDTDIVMLIEDATNYVTAWESDNSVSLSEYDKKTWIKYRCAKQIAISEPEAAGVGDYGNTTRATQILEYQKEIDAIKSKYGVSTATGAIVVFTEPIP